VAALRSGLFVFAVVLLVFIVWLVLVVPQAGR
jgi:hypothetical protein